jgi:hypothetical protein
MLAHSQCQLFSDHSVIPISDNPSTKEEVTRAIQIQFTYPSVLDSKFGSVRFESSLSEVLVSLTVPFLIFLMTYCVGHFHSQAKRISPLLGQFCSLQML